MPYDGDVYDVYTYETIVRETWLWLICTEKRPVLLQEAVEPEIRQNEGMLRLLPACFGLQVHMFVMHTAMYEGGETELGTGLAGRSPMPMSPYTLPALFYVHIHRSPPMESWGKGGWESLEGQRGWRVMLRRKAPCFRGHTHI